MKPDTLLCRGVQGNFHCRDDRQMMGRHQEQQYESVTFVDRATRRQRSKVRIGDDSTATKTTRATRKRQGKTQKTQHRQLREKRKQSRKRSRGKGCKGRTEEVPEKVGLSLSEALGDTVIDMGSEKLREPTVEGGDEPRKLGYPRPMPYTCGQAGRRSRTRISKHQATAFVVRGGRLSRSMH